ncbi:response regulator transcription factor [Clavibacter michiganensis]|uniref:response regulator transcription factor n=1 Tax=Clavibacter michiganensis TaxID=28447 RepID=UPI00374D349C
MRYWGVQAECQIRGNGARLSEISVALADDHELFRSGLAELLSRSPYIRVVGSADNGQQAVELCATSGVEVLLLDASMPGYTIDETLRGLRRQSPETQVIVISMHTEAVVRELLRSIPVSNILSKNTPYADVVAAIREACGRLPSDAPRLSARELDVMRLVYAAYTNAQIATALDIDPGTVKRHMGKIFGKLNAVSRLDAVNCARTLGLLPP